MRHSVKFLQGSRVVRVDYLNLLDPENVDRLCPRRHKSPCLITKTLVTQFLTCVSQLTYGVNFSTVLNFDRTVLDSQKQLDQKFYICLLSLKPLVIPAIYFLVIAV